MQGRRSFVQRASSMPAHVELLHVSHALARLCFRIEPSISEHSLDFCGQEPGQTALRCVVTASLQVLYSPRDSSEVDNVLQW